VASLILGVDPSTVDMALAWVDIETGRLEKAELRPVPRLRDVPNYVSAAATIHPGDLVSPEGDPVIGVVERAGIHGIQKRGGKIAKTVRRSDVTYNWTAVEDLIAIAERLAAAEGFLLAYVLPRKGAVHWTQQSWCGRQSKKDRHAALLRSTTREEQALAELAAPPYKRHNIHDAWAIALWAFRGLHE